MSSPSSKAPTSSKSRVVAEGSGAEIQRRLAFLQTLTGGELQEVRLREIERSALYYLDRAGFESFVAVSLMSRDRPDRWACWAAESIVWTVHRIRAGEWKEALRGWGKLKEEQGRNGGFLPIGISDAVGTIHTILEDRVSR